jgi:hypothetical protein
VRWQRRRLHVSMVDAGARNDGPSARLCGRTAGVPAWGGALPRSMHCLAFRRLAIFGRLRWSFLANDLPRSLSSAFRASWRLARQSCLRWSFLARGPAAPLLSSAFRASWRLAKQSCLRWSFLAKRPPLLSSVLGAPWRSPYSRRSERTIGDSPKSRVRTPD